MAHNLRFFCCFPFIFKATFYLVCFQQETFCSGIAYPVNPANALYMKNILKTFQWNTEIDRDLYYILNYYTHMAPVSTINRIKNNLKMKWMLCAISEVKYSEKQETKARCAMCSLGWVGVRPTISYANYVTKVPMEYGINFTVTTFQTTYSCKNSFCSRQHACCEMVIPMTRKTKLS